jgi:Gpi18-like mannosyltransferase
VKDSAPKLAWQVPLLVFVFWRVGLVMLPFLASNMMRPVARAGNAHYIVISSDFWSERLFAAWTHWDGEWYLQLAQFGYHTNDGSAVFFPLYPLLLKVLGWFCLGNYVLAGILLSSLATALVFILFYELTQRDFNDKDQAITALLYLALFPTAFFLSAVYTESLFLALTLAAFLCVRHLNKWWLAGLCVMLATACRSLGILVLFPLLWEWWQQQPTKQAFKRTNLLKLLPLVLLPSLSILAWIIFNWLDLGSPLAFLKAQNAVPWRRQFAWPWQTVWQAAQTFTTPPPNSTENYNLLDFVFFVLMVMLFGLAAWLTYKRKYPFSYLLYFGLSLVLPLSAPTLGEPLLSFPRFALVIFPAFQLLALLLRRIAVLDLSYKLLGSVSLAFLCSRFVQWYWVA